MPGCMHQLGLLFSCSSEEMQVCCQQLFELERMQICALSKEEAEEAALGSGYSVSSPDADLHAQPR